MSLSYRTDNSYLRKKFGKINEVIDVPNLIEVQKQSYREFLMDDTPSDQRGDAGLNGVFKSVFPIQDYAGTCVLEFIKYDFDKPKYDIQECHIKGMTYSAPLRVTLRFIVFDICEETQVSQLRISKNKKSIWGIFPS